MTSISKGSSNDPKADVSNDKLFETDRTIVDRALGGDQEAMTKLVIDHQQNVYNLGLRLSGREDEAECVLQETFLKVFEKLGDFRGDARLGTWIHRIATNVALMRMRSRKGKYFVPIEEEQSDEDTHDIGYIAKSLELDPLELTLNEELSQHLEKAIISLPLSLRTAFVLKDLQGLSMADIAEETGKTVSAIKADLHRARVKLRGQLAEFIGSDQNG